MQFLLGYLPAGLPLSYFVIKTWGATGAAGMWVFFNLTYIALVPPLMDRQLAFRFAGPWLAQTAKPFALAMVGWAALTHFMNPTSPLLPLVVAVGAFAILYGALSYFLFLDKTLLAHPRKFMATGREGG
jgi:hypothetical protein